MEFNWQVTVWLYCTLTAKTACSEDYSSNTKLGTQLQNFHDPLICGLFSRIIDQLFVWENVSVSQIPRGRPYNHNPKDIQPIVRSKTRSKTNLLIILIVVDSFNNCQLTVYPWQLYTRKELVCLTEMQQCKVLCGDFHTICVFETSILLI